MRATAIVSIVLATVCCFPGIGKTGEVVGTDGLPDAAKTEAVSTTPDSISVKLQPSNDTVAADSTANIIVKAFGRNFRLALSKAEADIAASIPGLNVPIRQDINHDLADYSVDFTGMTRKQAFAVVSAIAKGALDCGNEIGKMNANKCNEWSVDYIKLAGSA